MIKQVEISNDCLLLLVKNYHESNCKNKEILVNISKAVSASMQLRSKKELIEDFVASVNTDTDIDAAWEAYVKQRKQDDLNEIIKSENLKADETSKFVENAFRDGAIRTTGTDIDKILPAMSRFGGGNRQEKKKTVIEIDGIQHKTKEHILADAERDKALAVWSIRVYRYSNEDIRKNFYNVKLDILEKLNMSFSDVKNSNN